MGLGPVSREGRLVPEVAAVLGSHLVVVVVVIGRRAPPTRPAKDAE